MGDALVALYANPDELLKHACAVRFDEVEDNEFNLNIPRYVRSNLNRVSRSEMH